MTSGQTTFCCIVVFLLVVILGQIIIGLDRIHEDLVMIHGGE